jgi:site-specific DNA recombinase
VLQKKEQPTGSIGRVPAPEIEALVLAALRNHLSAIDGSQQMTDNDRELVERYLESVILTPNEITLRLREIAEDSPQELDAQDIANNSPRGPNASVTTIAIPWTGPSPDTVKGIVHVPAHNTPIKPGRREALLIAIAKARNWVDDVAEGRAGSFAAIARREGKVERHIRLLAPLAFVSPRIVSAILDGTAPGHLTLTRLARALPYSWAEQERRIEAPPLIRH